MDSLIQIFGTPACRSRLESTRKTDARKTSRHAGWSIAMGCVTAAVGIFMIVYSISTAAVPFMRSPLIVVAAAQLVFAFASRTPESFAAEALVAMYAVVTIVLLVLPVPELVTIAFVLGVALLVQGVLEAALAFTLPAPMRAGWGLLGAACSLLLGVLVLAEWPSSAARAIEALAGASVLFSGIARIAISRGIPVERPHLGRFSGRRATRRVP
jgi:uncharacterized membrane protein HdeD (DUF308 family)